MVDLYTFTEDMKDAVTRFAQDWVANNRADAESWPLHQPTPEWHEHFSMWIEDNR